MSRLLSLVLIFILIVLGLAFAVGNAKPVEVNYFLATRELPLAMTLVVALVFGALIGLLFSLTLLVRMKRETLRLRRQIRLVEQEVVNLRNIPIKDSP